MVETIEQAHMHTDTKTTLWLSSRSGWRRLPAIELRNRQFNLPARTQHRPPNIGRHCKRWTWSEPGQPVRLHPMPRETIVWLYTYPIHTGDGRYTYCPGVWACMRSRLAVVP